MPSARHHGIKCPLARSSECASAATKWSATSVGIRMPLAQQDEGHPSTDLHPKPCRSSSTCASRYSIKGTSSEAVGVLIQPPSGEQAARGIQMPMRCRTRSTDISWSKASQTFAPSACHHVFACPCSIIAHVHVLLRLQAGHQPPSGVQPRIIRAQSATQ